MNTFLADFDLFSCIGEKLACVYVLFLFILVILLFLSAFSNTMSISTTIVATFLINGLPLKIGIFSWIFNVCLIFSPYSLSESDYH